MRTRAKRSVGSHQAAVRTEPATRMPQDYREPSRGPGPPKAPLRSLSERLSARSGHFDVKPALAFPLPTKKDKETDHRFFSPVGSLSERSTFGPGFSGLSKF